MRSRLILAGCLVSCFALAGVGCSKLVSVEGKVTLDGNPIDGASVVFIPEEPKQERGSGMADATSDQEGNFQLWTVNDVGAFPGKYKVTVSKRVMPPNPAQRPVNPMREPEETLPRIYTTPETTPLQVEVPKGGARDLQLELKRPESGTR